MSKTRELLKVESITEFVPLVVKLCGSGSFGSVWIFRGQGHRRETLPLLPKLVEPVSFIRIIQPSWNGNF
jgi:hypothetical protein